eukprot:PhF_6_TR27814/c0_g1_i1/m.40564
MFVHSIRETQSLLDLIVPYVSLKAPVFTVERLRRQLPERIVRRILLHRLWNSILSGSDAFSLNIEPTFPNCDDNAVTLLFTSHDIAASQIAYSASKILSTFVGLPVCVRCVQSWLSATTRPMRGGHGATAVLKLNANEAALSVHKTTTTTAAATVAVTSLYDLCSSTNPAMAGLFRSFSIEKRSGVASVLRLLGDTTTTTSPATSPQHSNTSNTSMALSNDRIRSRSAVANVVLTVCLCLGIPYCRTSECFMSGTPTNTSLSAKKYTLCTFCGEQLLGVTGVDLRDHIELQQNVDSLLGNNNNRISPSPPPSSVFEDDVVNTLEFLLHCPLASVSP